MDRSQDKVLSSQAKLQTLDQSKSIHQKVHENQAGIIGVNRVAQRKISSESIDNLTYVDARNGSEGVNNRKSDPLISPLQAQYLHTVNPGGGMSLPYLPNPTIDPRALGNFFYGYHPQMIGFPGYPGVYGQRLPNGEEVRENRSSTSTPGDRSESGRETKEPIRTESVIKIATERNDSRKQDSTEKRQSRPTSEEYARHYSDRNGDSDPSRHINPYRGSRDKLDGPLGTSNGDTRNVSSKQMVESSSSERTLGAFGAYQSSSVYSKSTPVSYPSEYTHSNQKPDYSKTTPNSSSMFASMPKLTPIAPRVIPSQGFPASSTAAEVTERQSISGSVWRPPNMGYPTREYPLSSNAEALAAHRASVSENSSRNGETTEAQRINYLGHSVYENSSHSQESLVARDRHFPYSWERTEISSRYPGHSAYQGYGYGRTFQAKRPNEKENIKETEEIRNRTSDSSKESAKSPDRSSTVRYTKESIKPSSVDVAKNAREQTSQNYKAVVTSQQDVPSRNQATLSKNEKPVIPENVRYKVKDERKCVLKSDKVTVYPRQGQAYVVSVRETPQKVSDYFANGRVPSGDVTTVSSDSSERSQLPIGYETASKKEDGQRLGNNREGSNKTRDKPPEKNISEGTPSGDYQRRSVEPSANERLLNTEEAKKPNDRNNNSSFGAYQYPGFQSQNERSRALNRITLSQDKVFVPPNATLEMFEKRELEMERAAAASASCRTAEGSRAGQFGPNMRQKPSVRKENEVETTRNHSLEQSNSRTSINKQEENPRCDVSNKSSDDEELKIIEDKVVTQPRTLRTEEKRSSSSPRHSRITSPVAPATSANNPPYLTPFGVNFPARRTPNESETTARENAERSLQAYMYGANLQYQQNSPYLGSRADVPVMLNVDPLYGTMYKQHMMDPSQGGTVMQDPLTGSLVVVPEAMMNPVFNPLVAAESQLMLDPSRFWGMQASMEDPRWQQFYQQQKQIYEQMEKYNHGIMIAQQQGRWPSYSLYPFYQKQIETQRKQEETERSLRNVDQRPKSRDDQPSQPRAEKNEDTIPKEKKRSSTEERFFHDSRREELDSRWESSNRCQEFKGDSRSLSYPEKQEKVPTRETVKPQPAEVSEESDKLKEIKKSQKSQCLFRRLWVTRAENCLNKYCEDHNINPLKFNTSITYRSRSKEQEQDRQFQQYMLQEPVFNPSKFPFSRIPTSLSTTSNPKSPSEVPHDRVRDLRENSRGESNQSSDVPRPEFSPQVVSAAATLANMDFGTRFPFTQQSSKQLDPQNALRCSEQLDSANKRAIPNQNVPKEENTIHQPSAVGKTPNDRVSIPAVNTSSQLYSSTKTTPAGTTTSNMFNERERPTDSSNNEKNIYDTTKDCLIRDSARRKSSSASSQNSTKMDYHSNSEGECSRLLVAKAEKLPQDEELEVVRIDTPYAFTDAETTNISAQKRQDMDLLMSLSKVNSYPLESPSSKSEIVWFVGSEEEEEEEDLEVRTINSSVRPTIKSELKGHDKENYFKLSLQDVKSESEKKCIREKIEKLREIAKSRTREERFTVLTRQKELKSPSSIVNNVTSSLNEVLDMNVMEKDIRMRLADLQKKYREKHRELARLQPKCKDGNDETSGGKSTPVKRGPGRPRKRKYFGASSRSGKTTPTLTSNGSLDLTNKSGGSSPSSCPQSPGLKSVTSEDCPAVKEEPVKEEPVKEEPVKEEPVKEEPVKKRRKKSSTNKVEEKVQTLPSPPQTVSSTEMEEKPSRVKSSKKTTGNAAKSKVPTSTVMTTSTNNSNMAKLISAISPSMFDEKSIMETESGTNTTESKTLPTKTKPKKPKKVIKREKLSSTDESLDKKGKVSPELAKETSGSPTSIKVKKVKNPKKTKKKLKQPTTPKTNSEFTFPVTSEKVVEKSTAKKKESVKSIGSEMEKKVERESNGDSSENDEVFARCHGVGALDLLAKFASSASFEKEKQPETESPLEVLEKGSKRGRPKKPNSPTQESEIQSPKKKKKKRKPSSPSTKSSKKSSTASEEKENDFSKHEVEEQLPTQIPQEKPEYKEQPKTEVLEEQIEKVQEEVQEEAHLEVEEPMMEQGSPLPAEPIKDKRRKSRSSSLKDLEDKQSFALFGDWQPRRSERIFINSSVAPPSNADSSPLSSPTAKSSEFGWPKKAKRLSKGKKLSKSDSVSDVEPSEEETQVTPIKPITKQKKKKSPVRSKKRRSSSVNDPDFVLRTPKRKASKRDRSYEEADEDDEDMGDEEEEEYHDEIEEDSEQTSQENQEENPEGANQTKKSENESINTTNVEMTEENIAEIMQEKPSDDSPEVKDSVSKCDSIAKEAKKEESTELETSENVLCDSKKETIKQEGSIENEREDKNDKDAENRMDEEMKIKEEEKKENLPNKEENNTKNEEATNTENEKSEALLREEDSTSEACKADQSSSDEQESISQEKIELPPEPVISFTKEELKEHTKMLLPVDRVFYRGRIAFYQDPDLYGIVLPGERGRRPHLRSTEQLLSQSVKDVIPPAVEYLPVGTRVCAHWSPQYRCFYPGSVIETPPDEKSEKGKLWVEFDDGDSGIFPLSDLRKIKTQFPVQVEDVESDVVVPERRPRSSSRAPSPSSTRRSREHETSIKNKDDDTSGWESSEDAPIKRSRGRGKRRVLLRDRTLSGEATDSDVPRGSRDSDCEESSETSKREISRSSRADNDKDYVGIENKGTSSQIKSSKRERRRTKNSDEISQEKTRESTRNSDTSENVVKDSKRNEKSGVTNKEVNKEVDKSKLISNVQKHQEDDSDAGDDNDAPQEAGTSRSRSRSSRLSELDLRKKSLTLNFNSSSPRSGNKERESPMQDSTSQDEDSGSCTEIFDESPQMENKGFQPRLGKRRRSQLDKLKQDKTQGELWQWSGKNSQNKKKGKGRKVFYKTIIRGDESISVGDCAVFTSNPSKSNNLPYVGKIENMWEGCSGNMVVKVKWFYHPEETKAGRRASDAKNSLYRSTHVDENDVQTISHKCEVVSPEEHKRRTQPQESIGTRSSTNDRSERLFCCVGTYDPSTEKIET